MRKFGIRTLLIVVALASVGGWYWQTQVARERAIEQGVVMLVSITDPLEGHDPICVVRVVNHLQSLGQHDAIRTLRRFNERYKNDLPSHSYTLPLIVILVSFFYHFRQSIQSGIWISVETSAATFLCFATTLTLVFFFWGLRLLGFRLIVPKLRLKTTQTSSEPGRHALDD